jgi:predicted NAD/FAD-binding protein
LASAYFLHRAHDIEVFEKNDYIGGHTHTVEVSEHGRAIPVDTGFIVYNTTTYPNLTRLFAELGVPTQASSMSFSVSSPATGLEYNSDNLNGLFAARRNALNPGFWRMLRDYARFGPEARAVVEDSRYAGATLRDFVAEKQYSNEFLDYCLIPAASAIWSCPHSIIYDFPAQYLFRFYGNHGLLNLKSDIQWRTVTGGSREYVRRMVRGWRDRIHLNSGVQSVRRHAQGVTLTLAGGAQREFDHVVIATHSDQALRLLADPDPAERDILSHLRYQPNTAVLHTDTSVLPRHRRAWAAWNYITGPGRAADEPASLTYWMNSLQSLDAAQDYCVTVNPVTPIRPEKIIRTLRYEHPIYSLEALAAQKRLPQISGQRRTHFAGAYFGYGFHEDGMRAGLNVARALGVDW